MPKLKKLQIIALLAALAIFAVMLAACKPSGDGTDGKNTEQPSGTVVTPVIDQPDVAETPIPLPDDFAGWNLDNENVFNKDVQSNTDWKIEVNTPNDSDPTFAFAKGEVEYLVRAVTPTAAQKDGKLTVNFELDPALPRYSFAWTGKAEGNDFTLTVKGNNQIDSLDAFYSAIEEMGYRFEVVGPMIPTTLDYSAVSSENRIDPDVLRRGIREHINFPMDVSSYPLGEAKEYMLNLARMRYNYMTFHSYPGHWTREKWANMGAFGVFINWVNSKYKPFDMEIYSGAFFYGDKFDIPDYPLVKDNIRYNTTDFCFPEMEPYYYKYQARSAVARNWLYEVMLECKRLGMEVQLSTEIRNAYDEYTMQLCDRIIADYPVIDCLEFISRETGNRLNGELEDEIERFIEYTDEILNAPTEQSYEIDRKYKNDWENDTVNPPVKDFAFAMRLVNNLRAAEWDKKYGVTLAIGYYVCEPNELMMCSRIAEKYIPDDVVFTIMPGHSSGRVYKYYSAAEIPESLLPRMEVYTWLEFDGFMYLSQFSATGIYDLVNDVTERINAPMYALMANHWRNAENYLSFRYMSEVSLNREITAEEFCEDYADYTGVTDKQDLVDTMMLIDEMSYADYFPGNIGFCIKDTWAANPVTDEVGSVWWWGAREMDRGAENYAETAEVYARVSQQAEHPGVARLLRLMEATSQQARCHLEGTRFMKECAIRHTNGKMPLDLDDEERAYIVENSNEAEKKYVEYLQWLTRDMIDRGVEGTLINYYYGPLLYSNNVRAIFGRVGTYIDLNSDGDTVPHPIAYDAIPS